MRERENEDVRRWSVVENRKVARASGELRNRSGSIIPPFLNKNDLKSLNIGLKVNFFHQRVKSDAKIRTSV